SAQQLEDALGFLSVDRMTLSVLVCPRKTDAISVRILFGRAREGDARRQRRHERPDHGRKTFYTEWRALTWRSRREKGKWQRRSCVGSASMWMLSPVGSAPTVARTPPTTFRAAC